MVAGAELNAALSETPEEEWDRLNMARKADDTAAQDL